MKFTAPINKPRAAFTLAEVLAALMFMAIVIPVAVEALRTASLAGEVARYRAVQDDDLAMGQIAQSVYDQIHGEIAAAAQACSGGRDGEARAMIMASRKRHGYPTAL